MGKPVTKYCVISRNSRCIISRCCAIVFMGAAILEQQEQQEKVAYKESFPTTSISLSLHFQCFRFISTGQFFHV